MSLASRPRRALVIAAFACVYVVWGSTYLAIRVALDSFPPTILAATRFVVAGGGMLAALALAGRHVLLPARELRALALIGALLLVGGNGLVVWAEQTVPSGVAALIVATMPLWMAGLATLPPFREHLVPAAVAGLVLGFAGVVVLVSPSFSGTGATLAGELALACAALSWSCGSLYSRHVALRIDPLVATAWEMLFGGLLFAAIALLNGTRFPAAPAPAATAAIIYLITFGSWLAFTAYVWLLANVATAKVATYAYVNPVIAVLLGHWLLDEPIGGTVVAGSALIVFAVLLVTWPRVASAEPVTPRNAVPAAETQAP